MSKLSIASASMLLATMVSNTIHADELGNYDRVENNQSKNNPAKIAPVMSSTETVVNEVAENVITESPAKLIEADLVLDNSSTEAVKNTVIDSNSQSFTSVEEKREMTISDESETAVDNIFSEISSDVTDANTVSLAADTIIPFSVNALVPIESGRNDSNPIWYKDASKLSFERSEQGKKEILITTSEGVLLQKIYVQAGGDDELAFLLPGITDSVSYNAGISWSPDGSQYVFMSNGGEGNYDLYLGNNQNENSDRLTDYEGKDGQAQWSPVEDKLVFVSGRSGSGDLFILDLQTKQTKQLTNATTPFLYPEWSPDGKRIAVINGKSENHDIFVLNDFNNSSESQLQLTSWKADDLRPKWSPDGEKVAFYTNYSASGATNIWSIAVVTTNRSEPVSEEELAASLVAVDVIPDIERGAAWLPDSERIAYVKNSKQDYNPIYIANINDGSSAKLLTETRMNHDVSCSSTGVIAFRAQVEQWDQIYLAKLASDISGSLNEQ